MRSSQLLICARKRGRTVGWESGCSNRLVGDSRADLSWEGVERMKCKGPGAGARLACWGKKHREGQGGRGRAGRRARVCGKARPQDLWGAAGLILK